MAASLPWRGVLYAAGLSAIAGFIDAVAYLHLGGYFVSFMSGNSTRASADLARGSFTGAALALGLVGFFVLGVVVGTLLSRRRTTNQRTRSLTVATVLLLAASILGLWPSSEALTPPLLAAAMGATNTSYTRNGEVSIGLTYMTGTLVKLGQHLSNALTGGSKTSWLRYLTLWAMISVGAIAGANSYHYFGLPSLWLACFMLLGWTLISVARREAASSQGDSANG
ncbi:YoaK family protein [Psychromicrobium sp. YIM B11713]|uniref:YoaK family protein n=1 Tax=Psychromicrobium sp. YIM B11713 TaxID=3145233 RepID=UPI00374E2301